MPLFGDTHFPVSSLLPKRPTTELPQFGELYFIFYFFGKPILVAGILWHGLFDLLFVGSWSRTLLWYGLLTGFVKVLVTSLSYVVA